MILSTRLSQTFKFNLTLTTHLVRLSLSVIRKRTFDLLFWWNFSFDQGTQQSCANETVLLFITEGAPLFTMRYIVGMAFQYRTRCSQVTRKH